MIDLLPLFLAAGVACSGLLGSDTDMGGDDLVVYELISMLYFWRGDSIL